MLAVQWNPEPAARLVRGAEAAGEAAAGEGVGAPGQGEQASPPGYCQELRGCGSAPRCPGYSHTYIFVLLNLFVFEVDVLNLGPDQHSQSCPKFFFIYYQISLAIG